MKELKIYLAFFAAIIASGTVFVQTSAAQSAASPTSAQIAEQSANVAQPSSTYRLRPLDMLEVKIFQEPDLDKVVRISADGTIVMPLIGQVGIAGLSLQDAQQRIKELYEQEYLVTAFATILIVEYSPQRVHVIGQVFRNGEVRFPPEETMTLSKAIADAGGPTRLADQRNIKVKRRMADGTIKVFTVNLKSILNDETKRDFPVYDGDTIEVPEDIF